MKNVSTIIKDPKVAISYLDAVKTAADAHREALGFMPAQAYEDAIQKGRVWIATNAQGQYAGHLMFGGKPPQELRIFQIHVEASSRGNGTAKTLIEELGKHAEGLCCLNLRADVANDLTDAIAFWEASGFISVAPRKQRNNSGRPVLIYFKRLSTPSLLQTEALPLSIKETAIGRLPDSYVLDLNVLHTLLSGRSGEQYVAEIMKAAFMGEFGLFVTPEFKAELERAPLSENPLLDLANKTLPVLESVNESELKRLQDEIREIVFPNRSKNRKNAAHDESDLRHLCYCIYHSKTGFVTEEKALLAAGESLRSKYGLSLFSPQDFKSEFIGGASFAPLNVPFKHDGGNVLIDDLPKSSEMVGFYAQIGDELLKVSEGILKAASRGMKEKKVVRDDSQIYGLYVARTKGAKHNELEAFFISVDSMPQKTSIFGHVLESFIRLSQAAKAVSIKLYLKNSDLDLEHICINRGFQRMKGDAPSGMFAYMKVPCPSLVSRANWINFRKTILEHTGAHLPKLIPTYKLDQSGMPIIQAAKNNENYDMSIYELESLLSPSLVLLPKRTGVIIPITSVYASELLVRQEGLLPFPITQEALLRLEKAYYKSPKHIGYFSKGIPIVFYESGKNGRGAIGCARITSSNVCSVDNALKLYAQFGVLNADEVRSYKDRNGNVQVVTFDNFKVFSNPISFKRLKEIGCGKAGLVGPEKLSFEALSQISHEGTATSSRDVLLSIQPDYVAKILAGRKTIELRKKPFPANGGVRAWIYSTSPSSSVEATAYIAEVVQGTPAEIWRNFGPKTGVTKQEFDAYFSGAAEAYALILSNPSRISKKVKLEEMRQLSDNFVPPQYYRYIEHNSKLFETLIGRIS